MAVGVVGAVGDAMAAAVPFTATEAAPAGVVGAATEEAAAVVALATPL